MRESGGGEEDTGDGIALLCNTVCSAEEDYNTIDATNWHERAVRAKMVTRWKTLDTSSSSTNLSAVPD
jgi:hypothetical protein